MGGPQRLQINAWAGLEPAQTVLADEGLSWAARSIDVPAMRMRPGPPVSPADWRNEAVGWGLVLAETDDYDRAQRGRGEDAPDPIRELLAARGDAPVFRYRPGAPVDVIRHYDRNGNARDPSLDGSPRGSAPGCLPRYLLIYGSPEVIPWSFQYRLSEVACVGRLDLEGEALSRYVFALSTDWQGMELPTRSTVVWAVDHGGDDITVLMRQGIAAKVHGRLLGDAELAPATRYLDGSEEPATVESLIATLSEHAPRLVVTTSHGATHPLDDPAAMRAQLGCPVDQHYGVLAPEPLLEQWSPGGAIWYAHACCSAGGDASTMYEGLVQQDDRIGRILEGVSAAGAVVAPLPRALLGAEQPLRAFVGHVEPTFNITLRHSRTGQLLTSSIQEALYDRLYQPWPVGLAFDLVHQHASRLNSWHADARAAFARTGEGLEDALAYRLMALDRRSLVILGDPTAAIRLPGPSAAR